ncbi:helix-turn-helix domain-containing protein [Namhaeicola litoreus]|uniref:Helix-turn-helix domain-containing protein n=1 Tax=Namhaeicola litoreus TaxID=1052145 RepID=A0ABW3Y309_9FLAO
MINSDDFARRLKSVMDFYQLSASQFADKIDVQRSSISHLLSGRNKPSLDFVLKIIKTFDEVELYWLLNGKGTFPKVETIEDKLPPIISQNTVQKKLPEFSGSNESIERIVIFFKDGTFKEYRP